MPLLDSFCVNHVKMPSPAVRVAKKMKTPKGDSICVFDLRFCKPNVEIMSEKGIHTLEHLFAGFMRGHLNSDNCEIIDISPMGCRTGFYMSVIGEPSEEEVLQAWQNSMQDILDVKSENDIPELNKYQCGSYKLHSLKDAQEIATRILHQKLSIMSNESIALDVNNIPN